MDSFLDDETEEVRIIAGTGEIGLVEYTARVAGVLEDKWELILNFDEPVMVNT